jgi:hypothetical protein
MNYYRYYFTAYFLKLFFTRPKNGQVGSGSVIQDPDEIYTDPEQCFKNAKFLSRGRNSPGSDDW